MQFSDYKIYFATLGCAKNEVDSDAMRARLLHAGFSTALDVQKCDVIIINTCSFITEATEESIAAVLESCALENVIDGTTKVVVSGCMPSRYGDELAVELKEVDAFVPSDEESRIVEIVCGLLGLFVPGDLAAGDTGDELSGESDEESGDEFGGESGEDVPSGDEALTKALTAPPNRCQGGVWAYVKIADGCSRLCAFCTIPHIKGPYKSVGFEQIVAEVDYLIDGGTKEIVLIAQDTGIWGRDLRARDGKGVDGDKSALPSCGVCDTAGLLEYLASRHEKTWFRLMYLQPQGITDKLLATMATHDNICNYFDIPLQHANAQVLRGMNRSGCGEEYLQTLAKIRQILPDVTLRTTVIAGFPGETRAQARELERFIEQAKFDYVGVFVYSQEEGTPAALRTDQVPDRTKRARAQRLRDIADAIGFERMSARVGTSCEVLVIEKEDADDDAVDMDGAALPNVFDDVIDEAAYGVVDDVHTGDLTKNQLGCPVGHQVAERDYCMLGRSQAQAPEVDGLIHLDKGLPAEFVRVTIEDSYCYELDARYTGTVDCEQQDADQAGKTLTSSGL